MADVAMPRLSDSMEEGTILKWLKSDGDAVSRGDELVEIETDKANMTYESDTEGTLSIVAREGDTLPVGETIAHLGDASEAGGEGGAHADRARAEEAPATATSSPSDEPAGEADGHREEAPEPAPRSEQDGGGNGRIKASPVARRMAGELGLELSGVEGTGPGGRIVKGDVEAARHVASAAPSQPSSTARQVREATPGPEPQRPAAAGEGGSAKGETTHQDLTRLQQVVARRMAESKATAPEFVLNAEIEMDAAAALRSQLKEMALSAERPAPSFNDMVVKACALALREFPRANAAYRDGRFELYSRVNVGIAVAGPDALVVPIVSDADRKSLGEIARDSRALAERVRANAITPPELSGATFTVSNLGMYGIRSFTPVINPPQAAILGVGAITKRPVVRDGEITTRHIMDVTLACDHRILYGAEAAQFLGRIRELLEHPLAMSL